MSLTSQGHTDRCCNPHNISCHKGALRGLSKTLKRKFPQLPPDAKICCKCRKYTQDCCGNDSSGNISVNDDTVFLNNSNNSEGETSFSPNSVGIPSQREIELEEMLLGLKDKFASLPAKDPKRLSILTIAPQSWSVNKIAREFGCSWQLAEKSKRLRASGGILAETTHKTGRPLPEATVKRVIECYTSDANGRIMAGKSDVKSVKTSKGRELVQKRLMLMDLRDLYTTYCDDNENLEYPVSFSKFALLRPQNCILAGAKGTHTVCVCTIHQNCILLLDALNIKTLTRDSQKPMNDYNDCLKQIMCSDPTERCWLRDCKKCPNVEKFSNFLIDLLEERNIDNIQFSSWTATDRSTLLTQILPSTDFVEELIEKLLVLMPHKFISKKQSEFYEDEKKTIKKGEVIVSLDFSENYKYVVQDASQAFHFNNDQCTVFPVICYYKENSELRHKSFVFLSNSTSHDASAVYTMQKILIPEIKKTVRVKKLIYFSDGAKQHFKNRFQMINLRYHHEDFGVPAEWHFFTTAHGKGATDGVGALFKREAARSSLLCKPGDAILNSEKLFQWGQKHFETISVLYYSKKNHDKVSRGLNKRFSEAPPVPSIQRNHSFTFVQPGKLLIKRYSDAKGGETIIYETK